MCSRITMTLALVAACSGSDPRPVEFTGALEKGPFIVGSSVSVSALDAGLSPTGAVFETQTVDDAGRFAIQIDVASGTPVAIEGSGFYYNEVTGELSSAPIVLRALAIASEGSHPAYLNVLTHLAYERAKRLATSGMTVEAAEAAAEAELRSGLHLGPAGFDPAVPAIELSVLGGDTDASAYVFAASAVLVQAAVARGGPLDAALQELLNTLTLDLADDGAFTSAHVDALLAAQQAVDTAEVEVQLADRLAAIGSSAVVPDVDRIIDTDLDGLVNASDNCSVIANADQIDQDDDARGDACDNCDQTDNADQADGDGDGDGDACDLCLADSNPGQADGDGDAVGDVCDNCTLDPNADQVDEDGDGLGNACDPDFMNCQIVEVTPANLPPSFGVSFGRSLALSRDGTTLVIGAFSEDSIVPGGAVFVFVRNGADWVQQAHLKASNSEAGDSFGWSVAVSANGDTIAVGSLAEDSDTDGINGVQTDNNADGAGAVYVFTRSAMLWSQQAYVKSSVSSTLAHFGVSVSLANDGNTLAIGAHGDALDRGAAYILTRTGSVWSQSRRLVGPSFVGAKPYFGESLALSGDGSTLVVGAASATMVTGAARVYTRASNWGEEALLLASNAERDDGFGYALGISDDGNAVAVSAPWEASGASGVDGDQTDNSVAGSGAVYLFGRVATTWSQHHYIKALNPDSSDSFGWSLAMSSDGSRLAIGAVGESSAGRCVSGDPTDDSLHRAGAVFELTRSNAVWSHTEYIKSTEPKQLDNFGASVAIAGDGETIVMGTLNVDVAYVH